MCLFGTPGALQAPNGATRVHYPHGKRMNHGQLGAFRPATFARLVGRNVRSASSGRKDIESEVEGR